MNQRKLAVDNTLATARHPASAAQSDSRLHDALLVLAGVALWLAATAWMRPLMTPDEGRYASVAWEMLRSGDWLTPTLNGLPFFHKPPLFYWLTASALAVFGQHALAARFASLLGAVLAAMSIYVFTARWCGKALARRVVIVLLVQPLFFLGAQFANLDMLVAGCIVATVLALAHAALAFEAGQGQRSTLLLAYALAAAGVLAKGLIGLVLPAMVVGLWLIARRRWDTLRHVLSLPGALVFLLIAAPWFVAMQMRFDAFLHYFFVVQHFQRFAEGGFNNVQPFWFYPALLFASSVPCVLWGRGMLRKDYFLAGDRQAATRLLMALSVACIVLFFSLPRSKLIGYVLPAVPPWAWLMADASLRRVAKQAVTRAWWATLAVSGALGLAVVWGLSMDHKHTTQDLALALRAHRQAGEPVVMLGSYFYDVPITAELNEPMIVVDDWLDTKVTQRDNWRKELLDAAAFDPARSRQLLRMPSALPAVLCAREVSWVAGTDSMHQRWPFLEQAGLVYSANGVSLWRVEPRRLPALNCQERPNADSTSK